MNLKRITSKRPAIRIKPLFRAIPRWIRKSLLNLALAIIRSQSANSSVVSHARREFLLAFGNDYSKKPKGDNLDAYMQYLICNDTLDVLRLLSLQGDSGFSAEYKAVLLNSLFKFKPISNLTFEDKEWGTMEYWGQKQNLRDGRYFMDQNGNVSFSDDMIVAEKFFVISSFDKKGKEKIVVEERAINALSTNGLCVISKDGGIRFERRGYMINKASQGKSISIEGYSIQYPDGWWLPVCCTEESFRKYSEHYTSSIDNEFLESELNYDGGIHREGLIKRLQAVGEHMYGKKFKLNLV